MTRGEQELAIIANRGEGKLIVSSTHPSWTRRLKRSEAQGFARCTREITSLENGEREPLGGEWEIDREVVALRLRPRRVLSTEERARRRERARALVKHAGSRREATSTDAARDGDMTQAASEPEGTG